jgi:hemin uptake protein HemP
MTATPPPRAPVRDTTLAAPAPAPAARDAERRAACDRRRIESHALFHGQVEIEIEHLDQVYRLRQTSLGKLILTK